MTDIGYYPFANKPQNCSKGLDYYYLDNDTKSWKEYGHQCLGPLTVSSTNCVSTKCTPGYYPFLNDSTYCGLLEYGLDLREVEGIQYLTDCYVTCISCSKKNDSSGHRCTKWMKGSYMLENPENYPGAIGSCYPYPKEHFVNESVGNDYLMETLS